ncbi:NAD-dependent epimerase/dehydratase family protein [Pseudonocardia sichuanensis]
MELLTTADSGPRRVLVTGARGFIGRHLVDRLVTAGVEVHATTRSAPPRQTGVRWSQVDLSDPEATAEVVGRSQPDVIVHLASRAEGGRGLELAVPMIHANLLSAVNVMIAGAAVPGCRLVLTGSAEEHSNFGSVRGARSPYAASKGAATTFATLFHDLADLPVVVLRLALVYGPDDPNRKRLVPYVIDSLLRGVPPRLSSGRRRIDWVFIDDVIDAVLAAATEPAALGRVLDVGSGTLVSIRDAASIIADVIGSEVTPAFGEIPDRLGDHDLVADPDLARRLLGWSARTDLRTGVERTVAWYLGRGNESRPVGRPASA